MPSRMNYNSISYRLATYVVNNKKSYRKNSTFSDEDFFTTIIYTIAFIEECELNHESCLFSDIKEFISVLCNNKGYNIDINELTNDIMVYCFQNSGYGYNFSTSFLENSVNVKILEDNIDEITHKNNYKLTSECRKWLYSSYEMEELGQITLNSLVLQKQIKAGNFEKAKDTAKKLLVDIKKQQNELERLKRNVISDIDQYPIETINLHLNEPYLISKRTDEELQYLDGIIDEVLRGKFDNIDVKKDYVLDCVFTVKDLQEKIKKIIIQNQKLLSAVGDIRKTAQEQLLNSDFLLPKKYINFEKEVLETIKKNPNKSFDIHSLLSPLFTIKKINFANPNGIIKKQTLMYQEETESVDTNTEDDTIITEYNTEQDIAHEIYIKIISEMFKHFKEKNIIKLSEFVNTIPFINENLSAFKLVITVLMAKGDITFKKTPSKQIKIKTFNLEDINQFNEQIQKLLISKTITVIFDEEKTISVYGQTNEGKREKFVLNDIKFILSEGK
jgi:hypothetical protein